MSAGATAGSLGEFGLIRALAPRMPAGPYTSLGIGDDSAVVTTPGGSVVAAVDMVLEGRHFRRSWSSGFDVGVKAAARSLADIAAMGAIPTALLVAVALPESLPASWALDLASGLAAEAERAGAGIAGGDTASGESVLVSVTALGDLAGVSPVRRSGAVPGDVVAVAGTLGHSAAGLALLASGVSPSGVSPSGVSPSGVSPSGVSPSGVSPSGADCAGVASLVAAHLRPAPPYAAGPAAARAGASAMIDVSDGLIADLGHIAEASGVTIDVSPTALEPFLESSLTDAATVIAAASGPAGSAAAEPLPAAPGGADGPVRLTALGWILAGGEDHSLAATFPASAALPPGWRAVGEVRAPAAEGAAGAEAGEITVDGRPYAGAGGWQHFR